MPTETSATIAAWADEAFGRVSDLRTLVRRASAEFEELDAALVETQREDALAEAADVVILLHRLAHELGGDLNAAIDAKMKINRARHWSRSGDGVGQHIPSDQE